jgi:hypothetical protein
MKNKILKTILLFSINPFVFTQIQLNNINTNIHPNSWNEIYHFLTTTTSIQCEKEPKKTRINEEILSTPLIILSGSEEFNPISEKEVKILKNFFNAGGIVFINNALGVKDIGFDKSVKRELKRIFPDKNLEKIKNDHALFYSFYLVPKVSGIRIISKDLYGIEYNNQLAVIYSLNDLLGIWERNKLGNWLYECKPNGEKQRFDAMKLTVNIIMYALTGTYKLDAIHSPFIQKKLKDIDEKK